MEKQSYKTKSPLYPITLLLVLAGLCPLFMSCAPPAQGASKVGALPEVDILQMKENSDVALRMAQQTRVALDALNTRMTELEKSVEQLALAMEDQPRARLEEQQKEIILLREELYQLRSSVELLGRTATFQTRPPVKTQPEILLPTPPVYREAMAAFDAGSFQTAVDIFDRFLTAGGHESWSDDAWYWIGESYFRLGDYGQATSALRKVFSYPTSDKADDAQFLIARCFLKIGDRTQALAEFKQIEVLYPQSEYVRKAQQEMRKLGSR